MKYITYLSVFYIVTGLIMAVVTWYMFTQYDDEKWEGRMPITLEFLFTTIFIWPMWVLIGLQKETLVELIPFYRKHFKLLISIFAIVSSLIIIGYNLLSMID